MKFKMLLRKRGGVRARAAGAESGAGISNQPPRQGPEPPPLTSKAGALRAEPLATLLSCAVKMELG